MGSKMATNSRWLRSSSICAGHTEGDVIKAFIGFFVQVNGKATGGGCGMFVAVDVSRFGNGEWQRFPLKIRQRWVAVYLIGVTGVRRDGNFISSNACGG